MFHPSGFCSLPPPPSPGDIGSAHLYELLQHPGSVHPPLHKASHCRLGELRARGSGPGGALDFPALPEQILLTGHSFLLVQIWLPYLLESGTQTQGLSKHKLFAEMPMNIIWPDLGNKTDGREMRAIGFGKSYG